MIKELVLKSRSYRTFDENRKITREELVELVDNARVCPSAMNRQPLKYRLVYIKEECDEILALTKWAGMLTQLKLPPDGKHPVGYIIVCCDTELCTDIDSARFDAGVAAQTIMLAACEIGLGGCILGAFDKNKARDVLSIPQSLTPIVILALGKPDETIKLCDTDANGNTAYFRDENNVHYVPKRTLEDVIIN